MPSVKTREKRKFLRSIYQIQSNFGTSFGNVSRNFSFGLLPDDKQEKLLNIWFSQVINVKHTLYSEIYKDFKLAPNKYLNNTFDYATFFKGRSIIDQVRQKKETLTSEPVMEGLTMEINSSLRSFITNHKRLFEENKASLQKLTGIIKEHKEAVKQVNEILEDDEILILAQELFEEDYEAVVTDFKRLTEYENLIGSFNLLAGNYNREISQLNTRSKLRLNFLGFLSSLPTFPAIAEQNEYIPKDLLKKLNNLANYRTDTNHIIDFLTNASQKKKYSNKKTITRYKDRLIFWVINKNQQQIDKNVANEFNAKIDKKILQLEKHFKKKPFDAGNRYTYLDLLGFKARILNPKKPMEINTIISQIKGFYLQGKADIEIITLPGFSWGKEDRGKPLKNISLALKKDGEKRELFICIASSVKPFVLDTNGEMEFLKTTGGQKRRNRQPKSISYIKGNFLVDDTEGVPIFLKLHFGKSYARRYLFQKSWGLLSKTPKIFLNNARLKRAKKRPGDPFKYYLDITLSGERVYGYKDFAKNILNRAEYIIGIDRGEVKPIAYAIVKVKDDSVIEKGFLAESYITKLLEYDEKKRKAQKIGRVPKYLKSKISRVRETMLETAASEILSLVSNYKALVALENLSSNFKGIENSIIPKKTYKKVGELVSSALEIAGFVKIDDRGNYWGGLITVFPAGTSQTCIQCKTLWNSKLKQEICDYTIAKNFENMDLVKNLLEFKGEKLKLNENFIIFNFQNRQSEKKNLKDLKQAVDNKKTEEAFRYLKLALGPRVKQDTFICPKCSYQENADLVGAINIAKRAIENRNRLLNLKS